MTLGNVRREVFRKEGDYTAFLKAIAHACIEIPAPVLAFCLLPNHRHLAVHPQNDGDLGRWMYRVLRADVRR
jgi:putative transposase